MPIRNNIQYSELLLAVPEKQRLSDDESLLSNEECEQAGVLQESSRLRSRIKLYVFTVCQVVLCVVVFFIGYYWRNSDTDRLCLKKNSFFSPALEEINPEYQMVKFNGSLGFKSPYTGSPSPEIDTAWDRLEKVYVGSSSLEDVIKSGGSITDARLPEELGGGYMTGVEMPHQLHCVNLIRKYTYFDYYKDIAAEFSDPPGTIRLHLDHCLEMLRQNIMCHADAGLMTHHWVEGFPHPYPNFNTWHKCRNWEEVLDWAYKHQAPIPDSEDFRWPKIPGSFTHKNVPQPSDTVPPP